MAIKVENGIVTCIVQVEVSFRLSEEGLEALISEGALFYAWPNASLNQRETAKENAENGVNELPQFVQNNLLKGSEYEAEIIEEIENELAGEITTTNGIGEIGGVWIE